MKCDVSDRAPVAAQPGRFLPSDARRGARVGRTGVGKTGGRTGGRASRPGAVIALVAVILPLVLIVCAIAINVAYMDLQRTSLTVATDASVRAASRTLAITGNTADSLAAARTAGQKNPVGGQPLPIADADLIFGQTSRNASGRYQFSATSPFNAVRLNSLRDSSSGGGIGTFLGGVLGRHQFDAAATATAAQIEFDVVLVLDKSGTMAFRVNDNTLPTGWAWGQPAHTESRWRDLVAAVDGFLLQLNQSSLLERVGVVTYHHDTTEDLTLTTNYASVAPALDPYTQAYYDGATGIGGGIAQGHATVIGPGSRSWATKVLIVMTDGHHNTGSDPVTEAGLAFQDGIHVYTITFSAAADQTRMQAVANAAGGQHFHAHDGFDLEAVFRQIAVSLPTLIVE